MIDFLTDASRQYLEHFAVEVLWGYVQPRLHLYLPLRLRPRLTPAPTSTYKSKPISLSL